jgi:hypothetical protein
MAAPKQPKTRLIRTSDDSELPADQELLTLYSETMCHLLLDLGDDDDEPIPWLNVSRETALCILAWCEADRQLAPPDVKLSEWCAGADSDPDNVSFAPPSPLLPHDRALCGLPDDIGSVDAPAVLQTLRDVILAVNFLSMKKTLNRAAQCMAEVLVHKLKASTGPLAVDVPRIFGDNRPITEEELARVVQDQQWLGAVTDEMRTRIFGAPVGS